MAVNVKMGVDIGGFTSGIKQGQQILKGLNAEMKASEAEFKATGNAEQKMSSQTKTLNSQLNVQKGIADKARQALKAMTDAGIDPADTAYQKLYVTMMNAEAGASEAQAQLNALGGSAAQAATQADALSNSMKGISKKISLEQVIGGIDKITGGLEKAAQKAVAIGESIWNGIMESARWADDTATMAQMYGIDLDTFLRMQQLFGKGMDTSVDAILGAQDRMKRGIGKDTKEVNDAFRELKVTMTELQDTGGGILEFVPKDADKLFWEIGQAIMNLNSETEKEAKATAIFGKSWKDLVPLFESYKTIEEYNAALEEQTVNSEETVRNLADLSDAVSALEQSWETFKKELIKEIAPALADAATAVGGLLDKLTEYLKTPDGQEMLTKLGDAVSSLLSGISEIDADQVVQTFGDALGLVEDGLGWIQEHSGDIVSAIQGIAVAFLALKTASIGLNIAKIVSGFSGLLGGNGGTPTVSTGNGATGGGGMNLGGVTDKVTTFLDSKLSQASATMAVLGETWKLLEARQSVDNNASRSDQVEQWVNNMVTAGFIPTDQTEEVFKQNIEIFKRLGEDVDVPVNVEPKEGTAASLEKEIGTLNIPAHVFVSFVGGAGGGGGKFNVLQMHANGLPWVPYDGYLAMLHQGERVLTASQNRSYTYNSNNYFGNVNLNNGQDIDALCDRIDRRNRRQRNGYGS